VLRRTLLLGVSTLVALLLAEVGARVVLRLRGDPYDRARAERALDEVLSLMTEVVPESGSDEDADREDAERGLRYTLHPYTAFTVNKNLEEVERAVRHFRDEPDSSDYDVFVLGGSVASIFCGEHGGFTRLAELLAADPRLAGRRVQLFRFAIPGYKQPQQLTGLAYLLARGCRPELVINLDGLNELRQAVNNAQEGVQPTWPSVGHWSRVTEWNQLEPEAVELLVDVGVARRAAQELVGRARRFGWTRSALLGRWTLSRLAHARARWSAAQQAYVRHVVRTRRDDRNRPFGVEPPEGADVLREAVDVWYESSLAIHHLCRPLGIRYLHLLQPTLHDEGSKPVTEQEYRKGIGDSGYDRRVKAGYPLLREAGARLAAEGVEAVDLSRAFAGVHETVYYDECHFGELGNGILAARIYEALDGEL